MEKKTWVELNKYPTEKADCKQLSFNLATRPNTDVKIARTCLPPTNTSRRSNSKLVTTGPRSTSILALCPRRCWSWRRGWRRSWCLDLDADVDTEMFFFSPLDLLLNVHLFYLFANLILIYLLKLSQGSRGVALYLRGYLGVLKGLGVIFFFFPSLLSLWSRGSPHASKASRDPG